MIEAWFLKHVPSQFRGLAQAVLGPFLAAADVLVATVHGDLSKFESEPLVLIGAAIAAANTAGTHSLLGYVAAFAAAFGRQFTVPAAHVE